MNTRNAIALVLIVLALAFFFTRGNLPEHSTTHEKGAGDAIADALYDTDPAGGDLSGTYPNPAVAGIQGNDVSNTAPALDQVLKWDASAEKWLPQYVAGVSDGPPGSGACDEDSERGNLVLDYTNHRLYVCNGATRGWDYVDLTD